jgi:hypothetical protein
VHVLIDKQRASVSREPQPARATMPPRLRCLFATLTSRRLNSSMAEPLKSLPEIEKLSDQVIRVLGGNPSKVSHPMMFATRTQL